MKADETALEELFTDQVPVDLLSSAAWWTQ
jgi:hypothetical protein